MALTFHPSPLCRKPSASAPSLLPRCWVVAPAPVTLITVAPRLSSPTLSMPPNSMTCLDIFSCISCCWLNLSTVETRLLACPHLSLRATPRQVYQRGSSDSSFSIPPHPVGSSLLALQNFATKQIRLQESFALSKEIRLPLEQRSFPCILPFYFSLSIMTS